MPSACISSAAIVKGTRRHECFASNPVTACAGLLKPLMNCSCCRCWYDAAPGFRIVQSRRTIDGWYCYQINYFTPRDKTQLVWLQHRALYSKWECPKINLFFGCSLTYQMLLWAHLQPKLSAGNVYTVGRCSRKQHWKDEWKQSVRLTHLFVRTDNFRYFWNAIAVTLFITSGTR